MGESDPWSDEFCGVASSAGPEGDRARELLALRVSIGFALACLLGWLGLIVYVLPFWRGETDALSVAVTAVPAIVGLWFFTAPTLLLGGYGMFLESRLAWWTRWLLIALMAVAVLGTFLAGWPVALLVLLVVFVFGGTFVISPIWAILAGFLWGSLKWGNRTSASSGRRELE